MGIRFATVAAGGLLLLSLNFSGTSVAQETLSAPQVGDPVVVYVHKFKPADFEAGKKLVIDGFGKAMNEHGQGRLTFFLTDEDASEVFAISIFTNGSSVENWHDAMARQEVLKELAPLRRQELILQEFRLENTHVVDE